LFIKYIIYYICIYQTTKKTENMKTLKLKAGKNEVILTLSITKTNCFHLHHGINILVSGWVDNGNFGIDTFSKELFFFEEEIRQFLAKNIKRK